MKKLIRGFIIGFLILFGFYLLTKFQLRENNIKNFEIINYKIQNKSYKLLVADSPKKWERGLMYFRKLDDVDGMIFIFPNKEIQTCWNKNTFMDLELLWIDEDKVIGRSQLPSVEKSKKIVTVNSPALADKVIELPMNN